MTSATKCLLLDVGQGTSNVILLGKGRAIIIDGGPSASVPLKVLKKFAIDVIELLIVSHNDRDHSGGISTLVKNYSKSIRGILFLQDRPIEDIKWLENIRKSFSPSDYNKLPFRRLEVTHPRVIWRDPSRKQALYLIYPPFSANIAAQHQSKPNQTSAVLLFHCADRFVLFPGDAGIASWKWIHDQWGTTTCDVMAAPHHGGLVTTAAKEKNDLAWLFSEAIVCKTLIVFSVGSRDRHHPRKSFIDAVKNRGITVTCTQLTEKCCTSLDKVPGGLTPPHHARYPCESTQSIDAVGCFGTVVVEIGGDGKLSIINRRKHKIAVDDLNSQPYGHPLCR